MLCDGLEVQNWTGSKSPWFLNLSTRAFSHSFEATKAVQPGSTEDQPDSEIRLETVTSKSWSNARPTESAAISSTKPFWLDLLKTIEKFEKLGNVEIKNLWKCHAKGQNEITKTLIFQKSNKNIARISALKVFKDIIRQIS